MAVSFIRQTTPHRMQAGKRQTILARWAALGLGMALIAVFLFYLGPGVARLSALKPMAAVIEEKEIETGMYFYTDVGLFSEAQLNINNSMDFPPKPR